jgi:hypothetical protein
MGPEPSSTIRRAGLCWCELGCPGIGPLCRQELGRRRGSRLLDLSVDVGLIDPQGAQLGLHESQEPGPVVPVEFLQRFDLLLQRFTLGGQVSDHLFVPLLGLTLQSIGARLRNSGYLRRLCSRIGANLVGASPRIVGLRLGIFGYLRCPRSRVGHHLIGLAPDSVGLRFGISNYLLCRRARIRVNLARLAMSGGDMLIGCPLGQGQHLQGLLDVATGMGIRLLRQLGSRSSGRVRRLLLIWDSLSV